MEDEIKGGTSIGIVICHKRTLLSDEVNQSSDDNFSPRNCHLNRFCEYPQPPNNLPRYFGAVTPGLPYDCVLRRRLM